MEPSGFSHMPFLYNEEALRIATKKTERFGVRT